jgi:predicted aspartyl protease
VRAPVVNIETMRVGSAEIDNVAAVVLSLGDVDGLLGNTFLSRFQVGVDTARGILLLQPR